MGGSMTEIAAWRALGLASVYGLLWAEYAEQTCSWEEVVAALVRGDLGPVAGVVPEWYDGGLRHTTTTDRTEWCVRPDGTVEIRIWRPGPTCVIQAVCGPDSATPHVETVGDTSSRHWDALARALAGVERGDELRVAPRTQVIIGGEQQWVLPGGVEALDFVAGQIEPGEEFETRTDHGDHQRWVRLKSGTFTRL